MSSGTEIILIFGIFVALLCSGLWVPFAITVASLLYVATHSGFGSLKAMGLVSWGSMDSFTLTAIPLFIMLALIMEKSGLSFSVYRALSLFVKRIPGGLLQTNIAGCALFAAISGSSVATAAAIGSVALPQLLQRGYDRKLSAGTLAAGGTLGIMIPPSLAFIIYGTFTETSIAKLFMAGVVPGLVLTGLFMLYVAIHAIIKPEIAPRETAAITRQECVRALYDLMPFVLLIGGTMGSIYLGLVTPTEAAGVGCLFAIIIARIWGSLDWQSFRGAMFETVLVSGNILFIVYSAFLFSYAISMAGVGRDLTNFLGGLNLTRLEFLACLFILYTILGCLIESIGMIVITVPLLYPVLLKYGIDPVWFGVILVLFIEMGQITPPVGINLFVIQSIWKGKISEVVYGTIPFHLIMFVVVALLVLWPEIALWLPRAMAR
jgi:tripartite ATP-independent transporter DctM subunit